MKSSAKAGNDILGVISTVRAERMLLDWANLPNIALKGGESAIQRVLLRYRDVFPSFDPSQNKSRGELIGLLIVLRDDLRKAWDAPDLRHREWYLFRLREFYNDTLIRQKFKGHFVLKQKLKDYAVPDPAGEIYWRTAAVFDDPPPIGPLEGAMFYLQHIADRARHCPNPTCPAPYFFATKKGQKYCSEACALPAQREAKRKWWASNRGKGSN